MMNDRIQLALFPDRIAVDKNFSPTARKSINGELQWTMDFEASFGLPREQLNDVLVFILKKVYDNPISNLVEFTTQHISSFHDKNPKAFNRLTLTDSPDTNDTTGNTYTNNLEVICNRLATRNLQLTANYIVPARKGKKEEQVEKLKTLQILNEFVKSMVDGKTKKYGVEVNPTIVKNLATFFFYTSHDDYKLVSKKGGQAKSWKLYYMKLNNVFNNHLANIEDQPTFSELVHVLGLKQGSPAKEHKRIIAEATKALLNLPSLTGLKFKWIKTGSQRYAYTPYFYTDKSLIKENLLIENEEVKFRRLDIYLIMELKEMKVQLTKEELLANYSLVAKALRTAYMEILKREPSTEEVRYFHEEQLYKGKYTSFLRKIIKGS